MTDTIQEFKSLAAEQSRQMRERKETAARLYGEILARLDQPHADDAAALAETVQMLDLSPEQVDADALAVRRLHAAQARIVGDEAIAAMTEAFAKADAAIDRARQKFEAELAKLQNTRDDASRARDIADGANRKAREVENDLRRSNPRIFGMTSAPVREPDPVPSFTFHRPEPTPTNPSDSVARAGADFNGRTTWQTVSQI